MKEGKRAITTSLTAIAVGPPPAVAITIAIDGAAVGRTNLFPPMTAVAIIAIGHDDRDRWGGRRLDRSDSPHDVLHDNCDHDRDRWGGRRLDRSDSPHDRRRNNRDRCHDDHDRWGGRRSDQSDSPHDVLRDNRVHDCAIMIAIDGLEQFSPEDVRADISALKAFVNKSLKTLLTRCRS